MMYHLQLNPSLSAALLLLLLSWSSSSSSSSSLLHGHAATEAKVLRSLTTEVFYSAPIVLAPGAVSNKFYPDVPFPRGHVAVKSFVAELVDEDDAPVPLSDTYLHHWAVFRYFARRTNQSDFAWRYNDGICDGGNLRQYYGLGSETRRTATWVPDPYGVVVGDPAELPEGFEERWVINVHAIDTRGVADRAGCTECRCELYNVTADESGDPLPAGYAGGLRCCYDETRCKLKSGGGVEYPTRTVYLKYTVKWYDMDDGIVPVKIYIFDVTDSRWGFNSTNSSGCKVEYDIEACKDKRNNNGTCLDNKKTRVVIPTGGDLVYGVAHLHAAGIGSKLYGQDGRLLCGSDAIYGDGGEAAAGNETGYVVGMTTCYPRPGSVKVSAGEVLTLESDYNNTQTHAGLMGLFYILVASAAAAPVPATAPATAPTTAPSPN